MQKTNEIELEEKLQKLQEQVEDFVQNFSQRLAKLERWEKEQRK